MKKFLGLIPILGVATILLSLPLLANLPGFAGEIFLKLFGFVTTPFCMEFSLTFLAIIALLASNHIRAKNEGDEFVAMEIDDENK